MQEEGTYTGSLTHTSKGLPTMTTWDLEAKYANFHNKSIRNNPTRKDCEAHTSIFFFLSKQKDPEAPRGDRR